MKKLILQSLQDVIILVEEFNSILSIKYSLKDIPYNEVGGKFPRHGSIDHQGTFFSYKFHGSGCTIQKGSKILNYSISPITENKVKIAPRDLMLFMKSYIKETQVQNLISKDMHLIFRGLELDGVLKKRPESIANFEVVKDNLKELLKA